MGFIREDKTNGNNNDNNVIKTISSKVLATVPASNITLDELITVNNVSINKDRRYYIEFLGSKKICSLSIDEEIGNAIACSINNYTIEVFNDSSNISMSVSKINTDDTTTTFTDLVIYEEEVKYLDSKYLETDLVLQNSISLGRIGDIGSGSSAIGYNVEASGNYSHTEGNNTITSGECQHVQGRFNIRDNDNKYAHIVGNGISIDNRSNAHTLDWQGNAWYSGKLSQEGTPIEDKDLATKKYVDDKVKDTLVTTNISGTTLALTVNKYQTATVVDGTEITLPAVTSFTKIHLFFSTTADLTLTLPTCKWQNGNIPTISANKTYEFIFTYTTEWLGVVIVYG